MADEISTEEWRAVEGWPYEVSNMGRIRRTVTSGSGKAGSILNATTVGSGPKHDIKYKMVTLSGGKKTVFKQTLVHRIVCHAFHGARPSEDSWVAHRDGDGLNNRADNLRWASRSENETDKIAHGRTNRGERQWNSKLTRESVLRIRAMASEGATQPKLAAIFQTNQGTISRIISRKRWAWLE